MEKSKDSDEEGGLTLLVRTSSQASHNSLSLTSVDRVDVSVRQLSVTVDVPPSIATVGGWKYRAAKAMGRAKAVERTQILGNISLDVPAGSLMAIIGGSGSGKTSLLNIMAERMSSSDLDVEGLVVYNKKPGLRGIRNAYVLQQDILQPRLTCRETLQYAAELRLPTSTSAEQRKQVVEEIILELGLKECADTLVGDSQHKGLSGGEKRRLSIGIQLLANPSVLFLDEPTTGLDASSAYLLVKTCKQLAKRGRTLIMSIHQPRSDIFFLFDSVTVLSRGNCVYTGGVQQSLQYFEGLGFHFPERSNPADSIIDFAAIDTRTAAQEEESTARVQRLIDSWREAEKCDPIDVVSDLAPPLSDGKKSDTVTNSKAPLLREIRVLTRRSVLLSIRDPMGLLGLFIECTLMGTICGWIFYKLDGSLAGIRSMEAVLYTSAAAQGYLLLLYEMYRLCGPDLHVFDREHNEGCVSVFGYLLSRRLAKFWSEDLYVPLIFSAIIYYMAGLRTDSPKYFFIFFASNLISHHIAMAFATLSASISRDFTKASLVGNLGYTLQSMACGFFVNANHMPVYVRWTKWIAYVYYSFGTLMSNQFTGFIGDCPFPANSPECLPYTGEEILDSFGFSTNWIAVPLGVNVAFAVGFYLLAGLLLKYLRISVNFSRSHHPKRDNSSDVARILTANSIAHTPLTVNLSSIKLEVHKRNPLMIGRWRSRKDIKILRDITATFEPGSINAILGPSGSGKSSLLSLVAGRLNSSATQKYTSSGEVVFNNKIPSRSVVQSICSFVTQDDEGLLPTLTVRETLYYSAYLRLPDHMSRSQKRARADEIILKMGLRDCADTMIGDEFLKGISGGEKRRVTICVQLLNDPKVLLLDEPTSGLDSFTAASILQVLSALAAEGRTVICTIHQPRSDLFAHFGNILLLARGGRVAYNGHSTEMLDYFASLGHPCPLLTNPSDHVLDLVSVNLQAEWKEAESRKRVEFLLNNWVAVQKERSAAIDTPLEAALPAEFHSYLRKQAPTIQAYYILLSRSALGFFRNPQMIVARIMQVVGIGIIYCLYFAPMKDNATFGVTNRLGLVQQTTALYFVGMLVNMAVYPSNRSVFYREYDDNVYGVFAFFAVYTTLEVPFEVVTSFIFSVFLTIITGVRRTPAMFFGTAYAAFAMVNCGESIGIIFNTLFLHEGFAVNVVSVVIAVGCIMAGILSLQMPGFLKGINYISPLKYSIIPLINLALENTTFDCDGQPIQADGTCQFGTGDKVLETYGLTVSVPKYFAALAAAVIIYRAIAYGVLKLNRLKLGMDTLRSH
ncbi:hypothetical protein TRVA0_011S00474 [Trichomonascus vanleenenianus]|uniref:uncharacterized protein n=1 Tax=Trichomonascus vanleenenianus TaxID=2268995 RepID=UPI003ECBA919